MIDMKKKMAIVLSLVLACSMSMTAFAAPSPSITESSKPAEQVTVDNSVAVAAATAAAASGASQETVSSVASETSAVAEGTTFTTASGKALDATSIVLKVTPATVEETTAAINDYTKALSAVNVQVVNATGSKDVSLQDASGKISVLNVAKVGLFTSAGEKVASNGSVSVAKTVNEILGGRQLAANETIRVMYKRADGKYVLVPVVIINGVLAFALPSISDVVEVIFTASVGTSQTSLDNAKAPQL